MKSEPYTIKARVWEWQGKGSWHFATIEKKDADEIKKDWPWPRRGFGSIPVNVKVGITSWKTSIFPEKGGSYLLPIKKEVRQKEAISIGQTITITVSVSI
ncbi:MAG: DUF1905 domain-containing protein [Candidatus Levybacteria bacterium]|nr:DUF1905 domain-containing protein [Candidatus Levybacteria bacterium]